MDMNEIFLKFPNVQLFKTLIQKRKTRTKIRIRIHLYFGTIVMSGATMLRCCHLGPKDRMKWLPIFLLIVSEQKTGLIYEPFYALVIDFLKKNEKLNSFLDSFF